ncbi:MULTISPECIES: type II toxin-antitoxin system RelE/ParE family toxin [unclassified Roseateles]|uniref:type II toxin-antitoxin system RelE/ParE family toxin n=1 Tax=unclassified Roseateles TaxID=2626991 RepID=UPI0006FA54DD|nr:MULTISPECIES: type II toxin-antitoxin system RelE/ParE family toxin [unclassified Roseateles]KQW43317.1 plasmid stabilization protein [Pelomonas sp. Root405]KRA71055.1 plasmid stabilization protein [Pelomonas sp. Root662]
MARITRRPLAAADILEIWDYIAEDSFDAADRWVDVLDEKLALWATQPTMGRSRDELARGLRSFALGRYVVFVMPLEDGIDVVRVLHASRDLDALFAS